VGEKVRQNQGKYVSAVLTIMQAWRKASMPRAEAGSSVIFGGEWSDYCRYLLVWFGYLDLATALLERILDDPDGDALGGLMSERHSVFGSAPTTVRSVVGKAAELPNLKDASSEFPVEERGQIHLSKFGWLLKKMPTALLMDLSSSVPRLTGVLHGVWLQSNHRLYRLSTPRLKKC
jgi:hypothetical protein